MKILIGVIAALLVALSWVGWRYTESLEREGQLRESVAGLQGALEQSENQNATLANRFDSFDRAVRGLGDDQRRNQLDLNQRLKTITQIVQEPGDTDAQIRCLHTPVPAGLDRSLREPATPTGSR